MEKLYKNAKKAIEGTLFLVKPMEIDRSLFEKNKLIGDANREWIGEIIREAFEEFDNEHEKYGAQFYIFIPEKKWEGYIKVQTLKNYAKKCGGRVTDWVEWALQQAQRILNGESWEVVCDGIVLSPKIVMILWKKRRYRVVGNLCLHYAVFPLYEVDRSGYYSYNKIKNVVPSITLRI